MSEDEIVVLVANSRNDTVYDVADEELAQRLSEVFTDSIYFFAKRSETKSLANYWSWRSGASAAER